MTDPDVFDAIRRGYIELEYASPSEIQAYFDTVDPVSEVGHINNIKGILFEAEVVDALQNHGIDAEVFEATNHPITDIAIFDDGDVIGEFQLKATDSVSYISDTLEAHPDVPIIATSEVAQAMGNDLVIDSGISNADLTQEVASARAADSVGDFSSDVSSDVASEVLSEGTSEGLADAVADAVSPFPISPIGIGLSLLGFPFLF